MSGGSVDLDLGRYAAIMCDKCSICGSNLVGAEDKLMILPIYQQLLKDGMYYAVDYNSAWNELKPDSDTKQPAPLSQDEPVQQQLLDHKRAMRDELRKALQQAESEFDADVRESRRLDDETLTIERKYAADKERLARLTLRYNIESTEAEALQRDLDKNRDTLERLGLEVNESPYGQEVLEYMRHPEQFMNSRPPVSITSASLSLDTFSLPTSTATTTYNGSEDSGSAHSFPSFEAAVQSNIPPSNSQLLSPPGSSASSSSSSSQEPFLPSLALLLGAGEKSLIPDQQHEQQQQQQQQQQEVPAHSSSPSPLPASQPLPSLSSLLGLEGDGESEVRPASSASFVATSSSTFAASSAVPNSHSSYSSSSSSSASAAGAPATASAALPSGLSERVRSRMSVDFMLGSFRRCIHLAELQQEKERKRLDDAYEHLIQEEQKLTEELRTLAQHQQQRQPASPSLPHQQQQQQRAAAGQHAVPEHKKTGKFKGLSVSSSAAANLTSPAPSSQKWKSQGRKPPAEARTSTSTATALPHLSGSAKAATAAVRKAQQARQLQKQQRKDKRERGQRNHSKPQTLQGRIRGSNSKADEAEVVWEEGYRPTNDDDDEAEDNVLNDDYDRSDGFVVDDEDVEEGEDSGTGGGVSLRALLEGSGGGDDEDDDEYLPPALDPTTTFEALSAASAQQTDLNADPPSRRRRLRRSVSPDHTIDSHSQIDSVVEEESNDSSQATSVFSLMKALDASEELKEDEEADEAAVGGDAEAAETVPEYDDVAMDAALQHWVEEDRAKVEEELESDLPSNRTDSSTRLATEADSNTMNRLSLFSGKRARSQNMLQLAMDNIDRVDLSSTRSKRRLLVSEAIPTSAADSKAASSLAAAGARGSISSNSSSNNDNKRSGGITTKSLMSLSVPATIEALRHSAAAVDRNKAKIKAVPRLPRKVATGSGGSGGSAKSKKDQAAKSSMKIDSFFRAKPVK